MGIVWITYEKYMALINSIPTIKDSSIGRLCRQPVGGSEIPTQVLYCRKRGLFSNVLRLNAYAL